MRKAVLIAALLLLVLVLTLGTALAEMEMEDPVLCVAGQWLTVRDADPVAVTVILPAGTLYGEAGACTAEKPEGDLIANAAVRQGNSPLMRVEVSGVKATQPVEVTYGDKQYTKPNNGKHVLVFQFNLH